MAFRILEIIPTLDRSGAEKQLSLLAAGLPRDEFDVHVCALTRGGPLEAELAAAGVPVTVIGKRWKVDPLALASLYRHIRRLKPDLVHTWLFAANAYGRTAAVWAGVPAVLACERCVDPWKGTVESVIDRRLARRTKCIVANSPAVRDFYVQRGLPEALFEVIPNGVPPACPAAASREEILAELRLPTTARIAGLIGRLWPQKRVKDALWAADLMRLFPYDFHLLVLGDGPQRARLERFARQVDVGEKVHFLGRREDVPRLLPHFDVLWSPSAFEGQSNAVLEAMAAGVPVVATDIPGTRDLVVHGETGYLVPTPHWPAESARVNDAVVRGMAKFTAAILGDRPLAARLGAAGRRRAEQEFGVAEMVRRFAALYRRVLTNP